MSLYAKINSENIVENVIVCEDSQISSIEGFYIKETTSTKSANVGEKYDSVNNKFIPAKPYESWKLGEDFEWHAPAALPSLDGTYEWKEDAQEWVLLPVEQIRPSDNHIWNSETETWSLPE
jgi:hypothetical protein